MLARFARRTALAGAVAYAFYTAGIRPWKHRWDASPGEREAALPGDDLVPTPTSVETRAITVAAPPSAVWPWLVQMGYGRAGWYSYDRLDREDRDTWHLIPQFEDLALGSIIPTDPRGGFKVVGLEHERALVLYMDAALAQDQASLPRFGVSWTFVLQALPSSKTRLIERVRTSGTGGRMALRAFQRVTGFGIFLMQRKQLLGIKARAERAWHPHVQEPIESHVA